MKREIYPCAPLRFVAFELQFDLVPTLGTADGQATVYERLRASFPVAENAQSVEVTLSAVGSSAAQTPELRMLNMERTRSVTVSATSLTVQTSAFHGSDEFAASVMEALQALQGSRVATRKRVGLRYVDEVRVPGVAKPDEWEPYIDERLLGGVNFGAAQYEIEVAQGLLGVMVAPDRHVMLRYGPSNGFAVDPNGPHRLPPTPPGQFFLLDLDSFWQPADGRPQRFDPEEVLETFSLLDDPSHELFEAAITEQLRDEVLRRSTDGN